MFVALYVSFINSDICKDFTKNGKEEKSANI